MYLRTYLFTPPYFLDPRVSVSSLIGPPVRHGDGVPLVTSDDVSTRLGTGKLRFPFIRVDECRTTGPEGTESVLRRPCGPTPVLTIVRATEVRVRHTGTESRARFSDHYPLVSASGPAYGTGVSDPGHDFRPTDFFVSS